MKIINFLDGPHNIDDFFDKFDENFTIKYCKTWDELYLWLGIMDQDTPRLYQLSSAKNIDGLSLRSQKAKDTSLYNRDCSYDLSDCIKGNEIKYSKTAGVYIDADRMETYVRENGVPYFVYYFTKLSKISFEYPSQVFEWKQLPIIIVFEYKDDFWMLSKGYY